MKSFLSDGRKLRGEKKDEKPVIPRPQHTSTLDVCARAPTARLIRQPLYSMSPSCFILGRGVSFIFMGGSKRVYCFTPPLCVRFASASYSARRLGGVSRRCLPAVYNPLWWDALYDTEKKKQNISVKLLEGEISFWFCTPLLVVCCRCRKAPSCPPTSVCLTVNRLGVCGVAVWFGVRRWWRVWMVYLLLFNFAVLESTW